MSEQKKPSHTQVLIVGAGPTGLAAAAGLIKRGIPVRIIDKAKARSDKSKALGVQAGTLECLAKGLDTSVPEEMIRSGHPASAAWIHIDDESPIRVNLGEIPSRHNFILILEQSETERILEDYVTKQSVKVERLTELVGLNINESGVESKIVGPRGEETVLSDFVIGCDGAHSTVRHQMGIDFKGGAYEGDFILGNVHLRWPWSYDSIRVFVSRHGVIASFPMKGERKYRLILIPKIRSAPNDTHDIGLDEFRALTNSLGKNRILIEEAAWLTRFRVHHRMVDHFQKGRVFLAGDAAHIHSPAGGQGMNTGIQDALNLSIKLARHLTGHADFSSLKNYESERWPVARNVLRATDLVFKLALLPENRFTSTARRLVIPSVVRQKWVQKRVAGAISQMAVAHKEMENY